MEAVGAIGAVNPENLPDDSLMLVLTEIVANSGEPTQFKINEDGQVVQVKELTNKLSKKA